MKKLFGTDGIRGLAGAFPLDKRTIGIIGGSLTKHLSEKLGRNPRFIIGRDTRESGEWITRAFCAGVEPAGAACESAEVITTPGVAFLARKFDFDAGVVISASHNPFADNGIKIFLPSGRKLDEATEKLIERDIYNNHQSVADDHQTAVGTAKAEEFQNAYLEYLENEFQSLRLENFKMIIDCANGAAFRLAPRLFENAGAEVSSINDRPDGKNINENCGSLHLDNLRAEVLRRKADFGAAFDGDADRALFVDERGDLIDGDAVLWIMGQYLKEKGELRNDTVVATVMSNIGLEIALSSKNIKLLRTAVGDKYVLEELLKTGSAVGGEQSGHIIFPQKSLVGDGLMTTLFLLAATREKGKKLSEMTEGLTRYPQVLVNIKVREKVPFQEVAEIAEGARQIEAELGRKGRLLLRYSGTENLARVMIEGANQAEIEAQASRLATLIGRCLG